MLSLKFVREHSDLVKADLKKRQDFEKLAWVDEILSLDSKYLSILKEVEGLRSERNTLADKIKVLVSQGKDVKDLVDSAKAIPDKIKSLESELNPLKDRINWLLMRLPNILHDSVPIGKDSSENQVVREFGDFVENRDLLPHGELIENLGWGDFKRAAKVAGTGFYFLKGDFARLDLALINFAIDFLVKKNYTLIEPPLMLNKSAYEGVTDLGDFESVMYKIDSEDFYLIATSEHPMAAMYRNEIFSENELPLKLVGFSPCFRREIGKHGVDTRGLFRVHQFNKVEQFVFSKPEDSWVLHEELMLNAEEIFKSLGLAYRVVNICTGDIGTVAAKKYDLELWMPREGKFREAVSNSNCTSYQAVRSNIKFRRKDGSKEFVHTLNSTAIATSRALRAIVETYFDGSVLKVPKVLWPYMGGVKEVVPISK